MLNREDQEGLIVINKKNLWFLTLFSLILVLSVYYITMPSELLLTSGVSYSEEDPVVDIEESEVLQALRANADEELMEELDALKLILNDASKSAEDKNEAFDKMKELNINKSKETELEKIVEEQLNIKTFIKMKDDQIKVIVDSSEHDATLANSIMRLIQENFEDKKYITVQFKG
jgi:stage III sporulation protein AH